MINKNLLLAVVIALLHLNHVTCQSPEQGWDCYKCSLTVDELCVSKPDFISSGDVTVSNCTGYCTILRTEFTDFPGRVVSLTRDCEEKPLIQNEIRTDAHYTKYYTACTTNKCNGGDGIITRPGQPGNIPSEIIMVVEKKNGGSVLKGGSAGLAMVISLILLKLG